MNFTSLAYIGFLLIAFTVYRLIPGRMRKIWLFFCSIAFSGILLPLQTLLMLLFSWGILLFGRVLEKNRRKSLLAGGIVFAASVLVLCKYLPPALSLFKIGRTLRIVAPIGVSYLVFQCIAYMTEIYRGRLQAVREPLDLFLYLFFFPKAASGPIEDPGRFMMRLHRPVENTFEQYLISFSYIVKGFVRKLVVADYLAVSVDAVYASLDKADAFSLAIAAVLYSFQIYFDFSGYTDIAIGSAGLFGIRLTQNFNRPYLASSVRDFWKRWHISLSRWLKEYVYIPLGGNRKGFWRKQLNILITFLISGLWHGASVTFLLWGALHGVLQVFENMFDRYRKRPDNKISRVFGILFTFLLVTLAWVFFRIPGLGDLKTYVHSLFTHVPNLGAAADLSRLSLTSGVLVLLGVWFSEFTRRYCIRKDVKTAAVFLICFADALLILMSFFFYPGGTAPGGFIYFNF